MRASKSFRHESSRRGKYPHPKIFPSIHPYSQTQTRNTPTYTYTHINTCTCVHTIYTLTRTHARSSFVREFPSLGSLYFPAYSSPHPLTNYESHRLFLSPSSQSTRNAREKKVHTTHDTTFALGAVFPIPFNKQPRTTANRIFG